MLLLDISTFLGRLHPLVVHLPIGFLLLAVLFEVLSYVNRFAYLKPAVAFIILLGFTAATASCILGYILSLSGDYDYQLLQNHQIAGIIVAAGSGLLYLLTTPFFQNRLNISRKILTGSFIGLFILTTYAGHQGGNLTHGTEYLSLDVIKEQERKKPATAEEALLFEDVVQPILIKHCAQCHRGGKLKGELSVQTLADLLKGGKTRAAVVAGKLQESELYERISMDPSSKKFMPADGKPPLSKEETQIIKWWIEKGLAASGVKVADLKPVEEIRPHVATWLGLGEGSGIVGSGPEVFVNPDIPKEFNNALLDNLNKKGVQVRVMAHSPVMLDITMMNRSAEEVNAAKAELKAVAKHVVWLNLSNNGLTEKDLDFLPQMVNLEKLRLEKNPVSDDINHLLADLHHLEAVNLNESKLTRPGLDKLLLLPNLKRVYTWKTLAE